MALGCSFGSSESQQALCLNTNHLSDILLNPPFLLSHPILKSFLPMPGHQALGSGTQMPGVWALGSIYLHQASTIRSLPRGHAHRALGTQGDLHELFLQCHGHVWLPDHPQVRADTCPAAAPFLGVQCSPQPCAGRSAELTVPVSPEPKILVKRSAFGQWPEPWGSASPCLPRCPCLHTLQAESPCTLKGRPSPLLASPLCPQHVRGNSWHFAKYPMVISSFLGGCFPPRDPSSREKSEDASPPPTR